MLKARMKYGAVSAKVHAMYGKRITEEEWHRLSECSSVTEVLSVLKSQSGWGAYTSELTQRMGDEQIKGAVRAKQYVDLEKLLSGQLDAHEETGGNMKKLKFYVCPECGNVITAVTDAGISCCGRKLQPMEAVKASDEEKRQQEVMGESTTFFKDGLKRLRKNPLAMGSIIVLVLLILVILLAPKIVPYGYADIVKGAQNLEPFQYSEAEQAQLDAGEKLFPHIFGTDELGRDYFIRVVYGARVSLGVGVFASLLVLIIGIIYGSVSGFCGGKVDMIMMRIVDIIYSLPDMLLIILLAVVLNEVLTPVIKGTVLSKLGVNMIALFIVFGLLYWVGMARLIRGQILTIKQNEYILAAKCIGTSSARTIRKHILPNCLSVIIITTALQIPSAIFTESYLSFIGLGVSAPMPSLGSLANTARGGLQSYPLRLIFPALTICIIVLTLNLIGDGLRDAFDPKLSK